MIFPSIYEELIYLRTYSRWLEEENRREKWPETVDRYKNFFIERIPKSHRNEFGEICESIKKFEVMPSMRALWTAGKALEKSNISGYNCATLVIDNVKSFSELLIVLLNGTGCGFSVERQYVNKLPEIPGSLVDTDEVVSFADSKLGWAEGFNRYLRYLYNGIIPEHDLSKIRPKGARLKTFGGRASGPEALEDLLLFTKELFLKGKGRKLNSIECHDLCCKIAYIVIVGGVRRCLPEHYSVYTKDGWKKIKNLTREDFIFYENKYYRILNIFDSGVQDLIEIQTPDGVHVSTPNHKWIVYNNGKEKIETVEAKNLIDDDYSFISI